MYNQNLNSLLKKCTVKISTQDNTNLGTGFFVKKNIVLTCNHVIENVTNNVVKITWYVNNKAYEANAKIIKRAFEIHEKTNPDLALLELVDKHIKHSFVAFNQEVLPYDKLFIFGYPESSYINGEPVHLECIDETGGELSLLKLHGQNVLRGHSGSPVLNMRTGCVCGIITLRRLNPDNTFAVSAKTILSCFNDLGFVKNNLWLSKQYGHILELLEKMLSAKENYFNSKIIENQYNMKLQTNIQRERDFEFEDESNENIKNYTAEQRKVRVTKKVWEQISLLEMLKSNDDYLIVNFSGTGKTTYLRFIEIQIFKLLISNINHNRNYTRYIPIFVTSKQLNKLDENLDKIIQNDNQYKYLFEKGLIDEDFSNVILLVDGLDQTQNIDDILSSLKHDRVFNYRKARIIISSREDAAKNISADFARINLSLPSKIEVAKYLGQENYNKIEPFIKESEELIIVPILLKMLKTILDKGQMTDLKYRKDLYTQFIDILIKEEKLKNRKLSLPVINFLNSEDKVWEYFERISFKSVINGDIHEIDNKYIYDEFPERCNSNNDAEKEKIIFDIGIITELLETDEKKKKSVFRHQSFQAFFAARYIRKNCPELIGSVLKDISFIHNDAWQEIIRFFIGLESNDKEFEKTIKEIWNYHSDDILNKRLIFALKCLNETPLNSSTENRIIQSLIDDIFENDYIRYATLQQLDILKNTIKAKTLLSKLKFYLAEANKNNPQNINIKLAAIDVFGRLGTPAHVALLKPFTHFRYPKIREWSINAISKIGNRGNIDDFTSLISTLERPELHLAFVKLVGNIGGKEETSLLRFLIEKDSFNCKQECIKSYGQIGAIEDINYLKTIKLKRYQNDIIFAISEIICRNKKKIEKYIRDTNIIVRKAAIIALGQVGTAEDTYLLNYSLMDSDVRLYALDALSRIGTNKDFQLIIPFMNKNIGSKLKVSLIKAIGKIGGEAELEWLEEQLSNEELDIQLASISSIAKLKTTKSREIIIDFIKKITKFNYSDYNSYSTGKNFLSNINTAMTLIQSLEFIAQSNDILLLLPFLKSDYYRFKELSAATFKKICPIQHIDLLLKMLNEKDSFVQELAIGLLLDMTEDEYIDAIREKLTITKPSVYINFLSRKGRIEDIELLRSFLNSENDTLVSNCLKAIFEIYQRQSKNSIQEYLKQQEAIISKTVV